METAKTINTVCSDLGVTKADLAKRMGMLPSSLYRKLARESMTFEEFQRCLEVLGVTIEFTLRYPDNSLRSSQVNHEMLLEKMDMLETELEAARKTAEFHKKSLRDLRTELNSAVGYADLGRRHSSQSGEYLEKMQMILTNMELAITYALGETADDEPVLEEPGNLETLEGMRVLLVDDNELNREIMKEILVDHGLIVEEADNGREAVAAVKVKEPGYYHFILMDIEMPVMDGCEAAMRIRKLPNRMRANVPIIALTANACSENRERANRVGMDDFLAKPVNSARLLGSLARLQ
ncbi:MAG: response regulator [Candidatus Choladocola sp.]|nr:response regulator [Candidatus Choladocola sp.]